MRLLPALLSVALLSACSQAPSERDADVAEPAAAGPDAGVAALPGIALTYGYRFRLPAARIAPAQERHAASCEALGPRRCRITGLQYRVDDRRRINATLDLALDPAIARRFGRNAVGIVVAEQGALVETEIASRNAAADADAARRQRTEAGARLAEIRQRLSDPRVRDAERATLTAEAATLRQTVGTAAQAGDDAAAALAATPMHIAYEAGDLVPGFDRVAPLRDAFAAALDGFVGALATLVTLFATLLPWGITALVGLLLWRRFEHRLIRRPDRPE